MVYALVKEYQASFEDTDLSDVQKAELEKRLAKRKAGESESHTWEEVKDKLKAI